MGLWYVLFIFYTNTFFLGLFGVWWFQETQIATTSPPTPCVSPHVRQPILRTPQRRQIWTLHVPLLRPPSPLELYNYGPQCMHIDLNRRWACNPWMWET
ncbi:uncharacterized protein EV420DRAFT_1545985, partial [Desarmillaria tabescens]